MTTSNRIVVDMAKCQWASLIWVSSEGYTRDTKPTEPTAHGCDIPDVPARPHPDYPHETMVERAKRLDIIDVWTPRLTFQLSANHQLIYTRDKALSLWAAWRERIFNKSK